MTTMNELRNAVLEYTCTSLDEWQDSKGDCRIAFGKTLLAHIAMNHMDQTWRSTLKWCVWKHAHSIRYALDKENGFRQLAERIYTQYAVKSKAKRMRGEA